ncbi:MAG TPA: DUF1937 family protein [Phycisphaerae bacterium]|nr:DUF1937 family protein [Phycisphaerae bacterium]
MIYLAAPYSSKDPSVRRRRFRASCKAAAVMLRKGLMVFNPLAHSVPIAAAGLDDMDHDFWMRVDRPYLEWCHMVMVLTLDGWRESRGVSMEIAQARALHKPVSFISPADLGVRDVLAGPVVEAGAR